MSASDNLQKPFPKQYDGIIRRFSEKIDAEMPGGALAASLASKEARDEAVEREANSLTYRWQHLFSDELSMTTHKSNEELILDKTSRELAQIWLKFQKNLPAGHAMKVDSTPPNLADVWNAVKAANASWTKKREETAFGQSKMMFDKLVRSLDNHKYLLDMIPSNDKYVSLLSGALSSIAKATINHRKIAEGISESLDDIWDDIGYWRRQVDVHASNVYIRAYIAQLYVLVFAMLVDIMTWFKSSFSRLILSFDSSTFDKLVKSKRDKMQILAQKLENEGKLAAEAMVQHIPTKAEVTSIISEQLGLFRKELEKRYHVLGEVVQKSVRDELTSHIWERGLTAAGSSGPLAITGRSVLQDDVAPIHQKHLTAQIQANGYHIQKYRQPDVTKALADKSTDLHIPMEILQKIQSWTASATSQRLWIQGEFQATTPSRYTLLSAHTVSTARKAGVPVLWYFFPPPYEARQKLTESNTDVADITEATKFIYTLINQLLDVLSPGTVESELDFSGQRFASLFGPSKSPLFDAGLALLRDLLSIRPYLLFCVVDGLQFLEQEDQMALEPLVDILNSEGKGSEELVLKTLYTTDGFLSIPRGLQSVESVCAEDFEFTDGDSSVDAIEIGMLQEF